jgi:hypothetical protein
VPRARQFYPPELTADVRRRHAEGATYAALSAATGVPEATVKGWLSRAGRERDARREAAGLVSSAARRDTRRGVAAGDNRTQEQRKNVRLIARAGSRMASRLGRSQSRMGCAVAPGPFLVVLAAYFRVRGFPAKGRGFEPRRPLQREAPETRGLRSLGGGEGSPGRGPLVAQTSLFPLSLGSERVQALPGGLAEVIDVRKGAVFSWRRRRQRDDGRCGLTAVRSCACLGSGWVGHGIASSLVHECGHSGRSPA